MCKNNVFVIFVDRLSNLILILTTSTAVGSSCYPHSSFLKTKQRHRISPGASRRHVRSDIDSEAGEHAAVLRFKITPETNCRFGVGGLAPAPDSTQDPATPVRRRGLTNLVGCRWCRRKCYGDGYQK